MNISRDEFPFLRPISDVSKTTLFDTSLSMAIEWNRISFHDALIEREQLILRVNALTTAQDATDERIERLEAENARLRRENARLDGRLAITEQTTTLVLLALTLAAMVVWAGWVAAWW